MDAAVFVVPGEGPVVFRRDRLSIEAGAMKTLSADLVILSQQQEMAKPTDRRLVAQMLALAMILDPASAAGKAALAAAEKGKALPKPAKRSVDQGKVRVWAELEWLQSPEAGPDANALAACLGDVISRVDPVHPRAAALLEGGEKGSWKGWVQDLDAFMDKQPADEQLVMPKKPEPAPAPVPSPPVEAKILLETATVSTPLWTVNKDTETEHLSVVPVTAQVSIPATQEGVVIQPMHFRIGNTEDGPQIERMNRRLHPALAKQFGILPTGSQALLDLSGEASYLPRRDRDALSGAAGVLLGATLSGKPPTGVVIGRIEPNGSFLMTPDFWERLRALTLASGGGGRLVIPAEAEELLPWILTLDDSGFFLRYDLLLAANYQDLLERSMESTTSPLSEVLIRFQEVRTKGTGTPLPQFLANRFVRQRLEEIASEASYFASAKMLALQAAGERPARIPKKILAFELRRTMDVVTWLRTKPMAEIDTKQLDASCDVLLASIDKLQEYSDDGELLQRVRDTSSVFRTFSRTVRMNSGRDRGPVVIGEAFDVMRKTHLETLAELDRVIGASEEEQEPAE